MYQKDKRIKRPVNSCMTVLLIIFLGPSILSLPFGFIFATYDAFKKGNIFQGFLLLAVTIAVFYGAYKLYLTYRGKNKGRDKKNIKSTPNSVELATKGGKIIMNNPFRGFFVVGSAGSGKSESIAVPLLNQFINKDYSGIVYDFKFPTLANDVQTFLDASKSDLKHFYLNFNNPHQSHRVNPLRPEYLVTTSYAREYAQAIISNLMKESIQKPDFWSRSATDLLTACIWYLKEERPDICDLPHVCAMITSNDTALLELLQTNVQTEQMTISIYNAMKRGAEGQTSGVIGSLQGAIAQINTPELMYIFGGNDFSLDINNPSNPILLTVGSYPTLTTTFAPLCSLVITVATKLMNQPNKKQSFVLLDEAPTVFIPNIEILPNTGRSNKIATVLMCQDLAQLTDGYGKEKADVLFASCNNHFYGRVASSKTSEILSKQFGKQDRTFITASRGGKHLEVSKNYNRSESTQERDVIKPSEFLDLNVGEFAGITVESNYPKFKKQFLQIKRPEFNGLSKITNKSDVSSYYRQVREDVRQMLSRFETTSRNGSKTAILNHTQTNSLKGDKNNTFDLIGD